MFGLDEHIAAYSDGTSLLLVAVVAFLLGLRHAGDPDHVAAVSALVAGERDGASRARRLGFAWGAGHATTLFAVGLPIVLAHGYLPDPVKVAQPWRDQGVEITDDTVRARLERRLVDVLAS